jgi:CBS domain-containing protein
MMATTQPGDTDVERLLGTVGEAMTSRMVALAADLPADVAVRRLERAGVPGAPVVASVDWSLARAGLAMDEAGVNRLPVVDAAGRPVGILTRDDLIGALARRLRASIWHQVPARSIRPSAMAPD